MFDPVLERSLLVALLLFAGCSREIASDATIALGDDDSVVLADLKRLGARDVTNGLSLGYDPNGERNASPEQNYWRMWMLHHPKCAIETTFVDGVLVQLLFWDLRDREVDRYFAVMAHDEVSSLSVWLSENRFANSVVRHIDDGG